jgi:hypothetical protein
VDRLPPQEGPHSYQNGIILLEVRVKLDQEFHSGSGMEEERNRTRIRYSSIADLTMAPFSLLVTKPAYEQDEWTRRQSSGSQASSAKSVLSKTENDV